MTRMSNLNEVKAVLGGKISIYEEIAAFNDIGMARTYQKGKVGVVSESYKMILPAIFKAITFCKNCIIIAENEEGLFELFLPDGTRAMNEQFKDEQSAKICALAF